MLSIKENSLKDRTDNIRQSLDFNFEISRKKMAEKLNGLKKDVEFLRDNLSKSVQTVIQKRNDKNLKTSTEGSTKLAKLVSKQGDVVEQIESTIIRLNDKISELKLWNVAHLNQLEFQETELEDFLEKISEEFKTIFEIHGSRPETQKVDKRDEKKSSKLKRASSCQIPKLSDQKFEKNPEKKSDSDDEQKSYESAIILAPLKRSVSFRDTVTIKLTTATPPAPVEWSKSDEGIFIKEVTQATALWEKLVTKRQQIVDQDTNENSKNDEKSSDEWSLLWRYSWFSINEQIRDNFLQKVWSETSGKICSTSEVKIHMEKFLEQEKKREKRKAEIEKWKETKVKEGFSTKLDQMKAKIKKAAGKHNLKPIELNKLSMERREMAKMKQSLKHAERLLRAIAV